MDENVEVALRFTAAQLAAATAGIHLWIGLRPLLLYAQVGEPLTDPRQALFVLSSLAVLVGIGLAAYGLRRDYVYGLGIVLALTYIVGWLLLGGHPEGNEVIAYAWESTGHAHGSTLGTLVEHLFGSIWLVTTKTIETVLLGILLVLLYHERFGDDTADGAADDSRDGDAEAAP
ncbi:hypothetical protein [Haloarchaeobius sp. FL176]|uniref:hypothetical protein n=1 Tax=Haloarchaeobius sp. FL176 TaxID=2967129 RepID=UPI002149057B|nr:hypothetical protein [Haloarchaeobius sp. FL176]